ncbi:MAG: hypothetical protein IPM54_26620 [Polyangiaceae bacterium]|nr:hypothetical protein [Polyangiaceae bacterium]
MIRRKAAELSSRVGLVALCLSAVLGGCGPTTTTHVKDSSNAAVHCDARKLDACERAIVSSMREGRDTKPLLDAYAEARGAKDPWATLWKTHVRPVKPSSSSKKGLAFRPIELPPKRAS